MNEYANALSLTDIAAFCGLVFGLTGFILGILNYLRDRARVTVNVVWDMTFTNNPVYDPKKIWGIITVANVGRRPIYLSHASLRIPKGYGIAHLLLTDSVTGKKVAEGDPPLQFPIDQTDLAKYAKNWRNIHAEIVDSTGRMWKSRKLRRKDKPSWAKTT